MKDLPVNLDYADGKRPAAAWVRSLLWLLAAVCCAAFFWLCLRLSVSRPDAWDKNGWGGVAFLAGVIAVGLICVIKAIRVLFHR